MTYQPIKVTVGKHVLAIEGQTERSFRRKTSSWESVVAGASWLSSFVRTPAPAQPAVNLDEDPEKEIAKEEEGNGWYQAIDSLASSVERKKQTLKTFEQLIYPLLVIPMDVADGGQYPASLQDRQQALQGEKYREKLELALEDKLEQFCNTRFRQAFAYVSEDEADEFWEKMVQASLADAELMPGLVAVSAELRQCHSLLGMLECNPAFFSIARAPFIVDANPAELTEAERVVVAREQVVTKMFQHKLELLRTRVVGLFQKAIPDHIRASLVSEFIAVAALIPTLIAARSDLLDFLRTRTSPAIPPPPRLRRVTKDDPVGEMV